MFDSQTAVDSKIWQ